MRISSCRGSDRVPVTPEFRGMARALRSSIALEDPIAERVMDAIYMPLRQRLVRGLIPRACALAEAGRRWRDEMPTAGRLGLEVKLRGRTHLSIKEMRISSAIVQLDSWDESEPGIVVLLTSLSIDRRQWSCNHELLGGVTLHALSRRYHRGGNNADRAVKADLGGLAQALGSAPVTMGASFEAPVSCGRWAGIIQHVNSQPVLVARTFLS